MKIELRNENDGYRFVIDNAIDLEITGTACGVLGIGRALTGERVMAKIDIEKLVRELSVRKKHVAMIVIDSGVCRADNEIVFQIDELKKYLLN